MAGLYPEDDLQALYCDEAMGAIEDLLHYVVQTFGLEGEELKVARERLVDGWLSVYLKGLQSLLTRGGDYFADNRMTIADLKVYMQTKSLLSGTLDHVPADIVQRLAPGLVAHAERIEKDPRVVAYYASRN
jgi:glutathione S-transferase